MLRRIILDISVATIVVTVTGSLARAVGPVPFVIGADPRPVAADGRISTDAYNDSSAQFDSNVHHFGYQLGTLSSDPYLTNNPGFNAIVGSGLPGGEQLRFDVVRHLSRWDGVGQPRFLNVPNNESLRFGLGGTNTTATGSADAVSGFTITNIASGGSFHRHLNATLQGNLSPAASPATGVYFTCIRLSASGGTLAHSDALYIAYNNGLSDADFRRGMDVLANPFPGDANFDGTVNFDDLVPLAQHYNQGDANYFDGDLNNDRVVNFDDLVILAQHYNQSTPMVVPSAIGADWTAAQTIARSTVPEPGTIFPGVLMLLLARRRRD